MSYLDFSRILTGPLIFPLKYLRLKLQNLQIFWAKKKSTHAMFLQNKSIFFNVALTIEYDRGAQVVIRFGHDVSH